MPKMAVIGNMDAVMAFKALGLTVMPADTPEEASRALRQLAREDYPVIFITEDATRGIEETISRYKSQAFPAIIPIPGTGSAGNNGAGSLGMQAIYANVEKAVGFNILNNDT